MSFNHVERKEKRMADCESTHDLVNVDGLVRMVRDGRITRRRFLARTAVLLGSVTAAEGLLARVGGRRRPARTPS